MKRGRSTQSHTSEKITCQRVEKYSAIEKECLLVKLGVQIFRMHLLGQDFVVVTDHLALEWLEHMWKGNSRLTGGA